MCYEHHTEAYVTAKDLDKLFSEGISAFERSTFGTALERAWLFAVDGPRVPDEQVTAWPMHPARESLANEPDVVLMAQIGEIRRRMLRVQPAHREVLERWHGSEGAKWAHHERGRVVALYPLTKHGAELVARARRAAKGSLLELSDSDRLRVEVELDAVKNGKDEIRRRLITLATREGEAMYAAAFAAWEAAR